MLLFFLIHRKGQLSESSAVLEAFKFIESAAADFSDEDDDEDSDGKDRTIIVDSGTVSSGDLEYVFLDMLCHVRLRGNVFTLFSLALSLSLCLSLCVSLSLSFFVPVCQSQ